MEDFILFSVFVLLAAIVWNRSRRKRERAENRQMIRDLTARVYLLEDAVKKLKQEPAKETVVAEPEIIVAAPAKPVAVSPLAPETKPQPEIAAASVKAPPAQVPLKVAAPSPSKPVVTVAPVRAAIHTPAAPPPPRFEAVHREPVPPLKEQVKSWLDVVEEKLGSNWLGKIGISLVVLGIAAYLSLKIPLLRPIGKVLLGMVASGFMLGGGIWLERKERYRILATAGMGGGWALLFFLSWAIYNVPATRVITSATLDFVVMLSVAVAMVWHTLRYRSQALTGLAYLLAFVTVGLNYDQVAFINGLGAGILLAAGLVVIVWRYEWYELEVFGILASYLNHYLWLRQIIEPMNGQHLAFAEFPYSAGTLVLYWLIFRMSYVFRKASDPAKERISTVAALLNPVLLLALLKYQSVHPEWAFFGLLAIGLVETLLGQLPVTRRRRTAVIVLSTLGVVLLIAAFPFRYSGMNLSILWLVEAEALVLVGVWTREIVFRRLGMLAALLVSGHMLAVDAYSVYVVRSATESVASSDFPLAIFFALAAIVFYTDAHWIPRRWSELFTRDFDRRLVQRLSYVAALMAFIAAWMAFTGSWTAVAWCALAAGLAWAGRRFNLSELFYQANVVSAAGIGRVLFINLYDPANLGRFSLRFVTVSLVAILLYLTAHWSWESGESARPSVWRRLANAGYTWTASILLALLVWYELHETHYAVVAVIWAAGGLLLAWVGRKLNKKDLIYQANAAALAAATRVCLVNFDITENYGHFSLRLITVTAVAVLLYVSSRWSWSEELGERDFYLGKNSFPFSHVVSGTYIWAGSFLLALLAWYELRPVSVAVAWTVGGLVLLELGLMRKSVSLRTQAYIALIATFSRIFFVNLNAGGEGITPRLYTVVPIAFALFYAYWRLQESHEQLLAPEQSLRVGDLFCWLGTATVAALLRFELQPDWVATGWAALALVLIAAAFLARRIFLHQALLLSLGILFRTVLHNFYQRSNFPPLTVWQSRWVLVGSTVTLLFLGLPFLFRLRKSAVSARGKLFSFFDRHPEQMFFFIAVGLLTTMLAMEMSYGMITLAWGLEGLGIFLVALAAGERSFRLTGLGLLMLCVGKILVKDLWRLQRSDQYLTFVALGAALVLVSFLYTRYSEKISKYL